MMTSRRNLLTLALAPLVIFFELPQPEPPPPEPPKPDRTARFRVTQRLWKAGFEREVHHEDFASERDADLTARLLILIGPPEGFEMALVTLTPLPASPSLIRFFAVPSP